MGAGSPGELALANWFLLERLFDEADLQTASRLAQCNLAAAARWREYCAQRVLPTILRVWRGISIRLHAPLISCDEHLVFPCTADNAWCVRETLRAGVPLTLDEFADRSKPPAAGQLRAHETTQCPLTLQLPGPGKPPVESLSLLPAQVLHGPRVRMSCETLGQALLRETPSAAVCAKLAAEGRVPETAALLFVWINRCNGGAWPHFPRELFGSSAQAAKEACRKAGSIRLAAAVVAGAVTSAHYAFRAAAQEGIRPGRLPPFDCAGAKQAWLFAMRNGPYFLAPAMDLIVYWKAYETDVQTGLLCGGNAQKSAWMCAQRYLRGEALLPPPSTPTLKQGGSPGIGRQAWAQTVLPEAHCKSAQRMYQTLKKLAWFRVDWDALPSLVVTAKNGEIMLAPSDAQARSARNAWLRLVCRPLDRVWVAKWHPLTLSVLYGPTPIRCRMLAGLKHSEVPKKRTFPLEGQ